MLLQESEEPGDVQEATRDSEGTTKGDCEHETRASQAELTIFSSFRKFVYPCAGYRHRGNKGQNFSCALVSIENGDVC